MAQQIDYRLYDACKNGNFEEVKCLLKEGVHFVYGNAYVAFEVAIESGHLQIANLLIEQGIAKDIYEHFLLHWLYIMAERTDWGVYGEIDNDGSDVEFLIKYAADINQIDPTGRTALDYASFNYPKAVEILERAGAKRVSELQAESKE